MLPRRSNIAALLLLVAYLPLVVLSSLHVHHDTIDGDDHCLQCVGHYDQQHHHQHDCLYCHVLGQDYLPQLMAVFSPTTTGLSTIVVHPCATPSPSLMGLAQLRAPPAC
ncbi:MAG: hypothetical protein IJR26_09105 [Bacteroidales bacterium]|nr:hypothetical protein [Bacteroidales bacterium]